MLAAAWREQAGRSPSPLPHAFVPSAQLLSLGTEAQERAPSPELAAASPPVLLLRGRVPPRWHLLLSRASLGSEGSVGEGQALSSRWETLPFSLPCGAVEAVSLCSMGQTVCCMELSKCLGHPVMSHCASSRSGWCPVASSLPARALVPRIMSSLFCDFLTADSWAHWMVETSA